MFARTIFLPTLYSKIIHPLILSSFKNSLRTSYDLFLALPIVKERF